MELAVQTRERFGKGVQALRKQGLIPAELYGHGFENAHIAVDMKNFRKAYKEAGENTVITLVIQGDNLSTVSKAGGKHPAIIYDVQRDPVSGDIMHVDFYQVRMDEKIKTHVPLEFAGEAPAIKTYGGILNKSMNEIEVEALPGDLPHDLVVDLSQLVELNQSVYVKNIAVPKGVKILIDSETAVATVTEKMKEEEVAPAPVADVSEVVVETEEKTAERAKEKTEKEGTASVSAEVSKEKK